MSDAPKSLHRGAVLLCESPFRLIVPLLKTNRSGDIGVNLSLSMESSAFEGAIVYFPSGAMRYDTGKQSHQHFRAYILRHAQSWRNHFGLGDSDSLYLITGYIKCRPWLLAAFSAKSRGHSLSFDLRAIAGSVTVEAVESNKELPNVSHRAWKRPFTAQSDHDEHIPKNQSPFILGFRVMFRDNDRTEVLDMTQKPTRWMRLKAKVRFPSIRPRKGGDEDHDGDAESDGGGDGDGAGGGLGGAGSDGAGNGGGDRGGGETGDGNGVGQGRGPGGGGGFGPNKGRQRGSGVGGAQSIKRAGDDEWEEGASGSRSEIDDHAGSSNDTGKSGSVATQYNGPSNPVCLLSSCVHTRILILSIHIQDLSSWRCHQPISPRRMCMYDFN